MALIGCAAAVGCGSAADNSNRGTRSSDGGGSAASGSGPVGGTTGARGALTTTSATTSGPTVASICTARAAAAIRAVLGVAPGPGRGSTASSSFPQCTTHVAPAGGGRVTVIAEVDVEPAAFAVVERAIDEQAQMFPGGQHSPPVNIPHLGLAASWFPAQQQLLTTDAVRVVVVRLAWNRAPQARKIALAKAVARTYLGRSQPKLARGPSP
jgi:hypothetical protein